MTKLKTILKLILILQFSALLSYGQSNAYKPVKRPTDWWQADWKKDSLPGISLNEAYDYLKGKKSKSVIVAVLDDCVDTAHEDLKDIIWTNKKEIPGNGIDDDHNGYIDDTHGWCFVASKNNVCVIQELNDETRTYMAWRHKFEHIDTTQLTGSSKAQYDVYQKAKKILFEEYRSDKYHLFDLAKLLIKDTSRFIQYLDNLLPEYKSFPITEIHFATFPSKNDYDSTLSVFWSIFIKEMPSPLTINSYDSLFKTPEYLNKTFISEIKSLSDGFDTTNNFRAIVGDDPNNMNDLDYGTASINLIPGWHGSNLAGIIGANRENNIGVKGIADNVLIMPVIIGIPNGPIIDKDVVLAIHYAVDNGASVINMSFGGIPDIGEHVKEIREAFDYANNHNVLIVNAAGNEGAFLDNENILFGQGSNGKESDSYIRVGATTTLLNDSLVSDFSNFGIKSVDLFAPGTTIYSTGIGNRYFSWYGTSFSAPIVAGVAALLKSYFPSLTAKQIKEVLIKSVYKPDIMVVPPASAGFTNKVPFSSLSKSGGIVNAYNAVMYADKLAKKKHSLQQ